jgi:tetratricopeptide (TPR) repeat protein
VSYQKAFASDWTVYDYAQSTERLTLPKVPGWPRILRSHLFNILNALLAIDVKQRPSASDIAQLFGSYSLILSPSIVETEDEVNALPPFGRWQELVKSAASERQLLSILAQLSETNKQYKLAANLRRALVEMFPYDEGLQNELDLTYRKTSQMSMAPVVQGWTDLVNKRPYDFNLQSRLSSAFEEQDDPGLTIKGWKALVSRHPSVKGIRDKLSNFLALYGDKDTRISTWKELVEQHSDIPVLLDQLAEAYESKGDSDEEIDGWKGLVELSPHVPWLQLKLAEAYEKKFRKSGVASDDIWIKAWQTVLENKGVGDMWSRVRLAESCQKHERYTDALTFFDAAIKIATVPGDVLDLEIKKSLLYQAKGAHQEAIDLLKGLVSSSPKDLLLQNRLTEAYQIAGDHEAERKTWVELIEANSEELSLKIKLAETYQRLNDYDAAISYLTNLCNIYPNDIILRDRLGQAYQTKGDPEGAIIALPTNDVENDDVESDYFSSNEISTYRGKDTQVVESSTREVTPR